MCACVYMYACGLHLQSTAWLACCDLLDECHASYCSTEQSRPVIRPHNPVSYSQSHRNDKEAHLFNRRSCALQVPARAHNRILYTSMNCQYHLSLITDWVSPSVLQPPSQIPVGPHVRGSHHLHLSRLRDEAHLLGRSVNSTSLCVDQIPLSNLSTSTLTRVDTTIPSVNSPWSTRGYR